VDDIGSILRGLGGASDDQKIIFGQAYMDSFQLSISVLEPRLTLPLDASHASCGYLNYLQLFLIIVVFTLSR